jgi:DNA-binding SARP family transcriptional activator
MARLVIHFLGPPIVNWDGQPVHFATRRALALFAYLILTPGMQPRDQLAALFWERDQTASRTALRNTLVYIRQAFGRAAPIQASRDAIGLDPALSYESDFAQLRDAAPTQHTHWRLYRGELLAGLTLDHAPAFEEWLTLQREHWQQRWVAMLDRITRQYLDSGAVAEAGEAAQAWLAHDPLSEVAAARLMRAQLALGERAAAQHVFATLRQRLATELRAEPSAELRALELHARQPVAATAPVHVDLGLLNIPFVGRATELAQLAAVYHTAASGQAQVVAISGESGIGKSRLLTEFCRWAAIDRADILEGRAFEVSESFAYHPIATALRARLERERAPDDLLDDVWLSELARLLPELRERYPDLAPPGSQDLAAHSRLYEAITRLLLALAERAPLVLVIDDLHWADAASYDVLQYIAQRTAESAARMLIVVAVRSEAVAYTPTLRNWLLQLERSLPLTNLQLDLLTEASIQQLIERLAGEPNGVVPLARWLHAETGGQPFYLTETLVSLYDQGVLIGHATNPALLDLSTATFFVQTHRRAPLPPSIHTVIAARLVKLGPGAFALMAATAVLGRSASFDDICELAGVDQLQALSDHDQLVGLQIWSLSSDHRLNFRHDQIRAVAYAELSETRRRILHRRAVERLADRLSPTERAFHARRAGMHTVALRAGIAAGDSALALFAVRDAVTQYEEARRDLAHATAPTNAERMRLYERLGRGYELLHQFDQAAAVYHELLVATQNAVDDEAAALALQRLAMLAMWQFDVPAAQALLEQALLLAERGADQLRLAECYWARAQLAVYSWQSLLALADGARALELAQALGNRDLAAHVFLTLAHANANLGRWEMVDSSANTAYQALVDLGELALQTESLALRAAAQTGMGDAAAGARLAAEAITLGRRIESPWAMIFASSQLIAAQLDLGEIAAAQELSRECAHLAASLQIPPVQLLALVSEIKVAALVGADEQISALIDRLDSLVAHTIPTRFGYELVSMLRCVDAARRDRWEDASSYARAAFDQRELEALGPDLPRWWLIAALVRGGAREQAEREVARIAGLAGDNPRHQLLLLRCDAAFAAETGAADRAADLLTEAAQLAARLGLPIEQIGIAQALAAAHRMAGTDNQAAAAQARAAALSSQIVERIADPTLRRGVAQAMHSWQ